MEHASKCIRFVEHCQVWKPEKHGAHMAHKGYNGRIIAMWLGNCCELAAKHSTTPSRDVGQWLRKKHDEEGQPWPDDTPHADMRFPVICLAMLLGPTLLKVICHDTRYFPLIRYEIEMNHINNYTPQTKAYQGSRSANGSTKLRPIRCTCGSALTALVYS